MPDEILGYRFKNPKLLAEALTTPSFRMCEPAAHDNQRLEFLGDAVLGLLTADRLFNDSPLCSEGELTVRRTHMVSTAALCAAAARIGLAPLLRRNKGADPLPETSRTLADAIEAIFGAAWLDGGIEAARVIFAALELDSNAETGSWSSNPKGELQRRAQALRPCHRPVYTILSKDGKSHTPLFRISVSVEGVGEAIGEAHNKKEAEVIAAAKLLEMFPKEKEEWHGVL